MTFMIGPRCCVNATSADIHPIRKGSCAKLVKKLHATVDDPVHLFFFVKDEGQASRYARRGGERFHGNAIEVRIGAATVTTLRNLVAMPAAAQEKADSAILNQIATSLSVASPIDVDGRMRKRNPTQLLEAISIALCVSRQGVNKEKWARIKTAISGLPDDPGSEVFDEAAVVQHVIAVAMSEQAGPDPPIKSHQE